MYYEPLPNEPDDKGKVLRQAQMAELLYKPTTKQAADVTRKLATDLADYEMDKGLRTRRRDSKASARLLASLTALWADLMKHAGNEASQGFCYQSTDQSSYDHTLAERRQIEAVVTVWGQQRLIEVLKGFSPLDEWEGKGDTYRNRGFCRRLRATPKLLALTETYGIIPADIEDHVVYAHRESVPIVLKARKQQRRGAKSDFGKRMKLPRTEELDRRAKPVRDLNRFLDQQSFSVEVKPQLRRIFSNGDDPDFNWNKGGRFYAAGTGNYQTLSSKERRTIRINGEQTTELDVSSSHLTIFLGLQGELKEVTSDLYDIGCYPREAVKTVVTTAFGQGSMPTRWPSGAKQSIASKEGLNPTAIPRIADVVRAIEEVHPSLKDLEDTGLDWSSLQFHESEVFLSVMMILMNDHGIPSLPVHDSLIVPTSAEHLTRDLLQRAYQEVCGVIPLIKDE